MGRQLIAQESVFSQMLEKCEEAMRPFVDWSLQEQLLTDEKSPSYRLNKLDVLVPTLVSLEIALAALWRSWGIEPDAVIGHSIGEAAASYVAGAFNLEDTMRNICCQGKLMPRVLEETDPGRPYVSTSPLSNWGKDENFNYGSMHYWGVWHGREPFENYKKVEEILVLLKELKELKLSHSEIHFIRRLIKKEDEEAEIRKQIKAKLASSVFWVVIVGVGSACIYTLKHWLNGTI